MFRAAKPKKKNLRINHLTSCIIRRGERTWALHGSAKRSKGKGYLRRNEGRKLNYSSKTTLLARILDPEWQGGFEMVDVLDLS